MTRCHFVDDRKGFEINFTWSGLITQQLAEFSVRSPNMSLSKSTNRLEGGGGKSIKVDQC